jgi:hypothetical protein
MIEGITDDLTELVRGILADGQRAGTVRDDLAAKDLARSVVAVIKAISCSRATDPSRNASHCFEDQGPRHRQVSLQGAMIAVRSTRLSM